MSGNSPGRWAAIGAALAALASCGIGLVAWLDDPVKYTWFVGIGELVAFFFINGDGYSSYRDMARHGIPTAIIICTVAGGIVGGALAVAYNLVFRTRRVK